MQFRTTDLYEVVRAAFAQSGLAPDRLELEITKSALLSNHASTLETLHQLRALGVKIAMDDFGTGNRSLSYLRCFPFDKIKIDRSFIHDLSTKREPRAIVRAVVAWPAASGWERPRKKSKTLEAEFDCVEAYQLSSGARIRFRRSSARKGRLRYVERR